VVRQVVPADLPKGKDEPPFSSALEMALRMGTARTVLLSERPFLSNGCLERIRSRTRAARFASAPDAWNATLQQQLGAGLLEPGDVERLASP
jgi:hypothetical protein